MYLFAALLDLLVDQSLGPVSGAVGCSVCRPVGVSVGLSIGCYFGRSVCLSVGPSVLGCSVDAVDRSLRRSSAGVGCFIFGWPLRRSLCCWLFFRLVALSDDLFVGYSGGRHVRLPLCEQVNDCRMTVRFASPLGLFPVSARVSVIGYPVGRPFCRSASFDGLSVPVALSVGSSGGLSVG